MLGKKKICAAALSLALAISDICALPALPVAAELVEALDNYSVSFTRDKKTGKQILDSNYSEADMYNQASGLQPGDYTDIVLQLKNEEEDTVDWYMTNTILSSLEDTRDQDGLSGGAYTYILTFKNTTTGAAKTLFSSDTVGGEGVDQAREGLHGAATGLQDMVYLDTFAKDEGGTVTLHIALDGETQGNSYQDTLAELQMQFAVEVNNVEGDAGVTGGGSANSVSRLHPADGSDSTSSGGGPSSTSRRSDTGSSGGGGAIVRTGDDTNPAPWLALLWISGAMVLALALCSLREYRRTGGGRA